MRGEIARDLSTLTRSLPPQHLTPAPDPSDVWMDVSDEVRTAVEAVWEEFSALSRRPVSVPLMDTEMDDAGGDDWSESDNEETIDAEQDIGASTAPVLPAGSYGKGIPFSSVGTRSGRSESTTRRLLEGWFKSHIVSHIRATKQGIGLICILGDKLSGIWGGDDLDHARYGNAAEIVRSFCTDSVRFLPETYDRPDTMVLQKQILNAQVLTAARYGVSFTTLGHNHESSDLFPDKHTLKDAFHAKFSDVKDSFETVSIVEGPTDRYALPDPISVSRRTMESTRAVLDDVFRAELASDAAIFCGREGAQSKIRILRVQICYDGAPSWTAKGEKVSVGIEPLHCGLSERHIRVLGTYEGGENIVAHHSIIIRLFEHLSSETKRICMEKKDGFHGEHLTPIVEDTVLMTRNGLQEVAHNGGVITWARAREVFKRDAAKGKGKGKGRVRNIALQDVEKFGDAAVEEENMSQSVGMMFEDRNNAPPLYEQMKVVHQPDYYYEIDGEVYGIQVFNGNDFKSVGMLYAETPSLHQCIQPYFLCNCSKTSDVLNALTDREKLDLVYEKVHICADKDPLLLPVCCKKTQFSPLRALPFLSEAFGSVPIRMRAMTCNLHLQRNAYVQFANAVLCFVARSQMPDDVFDSFIRLAGEAKYVTLNTFKRTNWASASLTFVVENGSLAKINAHDARGARNLLEFLGSYCLNYEFNYNQCPDGIEKEKLIGAWGHLQAACRSLIDIYASSMCRDASGNHAFEMTYGQLEILAESVRFFAKGCGILFCLNLLNMNVYISHLLFHLVPLSAAYGPIGWYGNDGLEYGNKRLRYAYAHTNQKANRSEMSAYRLEVLRLMERVEFEENDQG